MRLRFNALATAILLSGPLSGLTIPAAADEAQDVPTDLLQTLQLASANDPNLAAVRASRAAADQGTTIARAGLLPQVVGNGAISNNALTQNINTPTTIAGLGVIPPGDYTSTYRNTQWAVKLTQPLFAWDSWHQYQAAKAQQSQADAQADDQTQQLLLSTAEAYFNVLRAEDALALAKAQEAAFDKQREQTVARFKLGAAPHADVLEAEARRDDATAQRLNADIAVVNARSLLDAAVGRTLGPLADLGEQLPMDAPVPDSADDWVTLARDHNPGLIATRLNATALEANKDSLKAGYMPRVNLFASYGDRVNNNLNTVAEYNQAVSFNAGTTRAIGIEAQWEMFAGGRTRAGVRQAGYQAEAARLQAEAREHQVLSGTRTGFLTVKADASRLQARQRAQASAQAAWETAQAGYQLGTRSIVDVLLAETNVYAARRDYANTRYDYVIDTLRLHAATGQLNEALINRINTWLHTSASAAR